MSVWALMSMFHPPRALARPVWPGATGSGRDPDLLGLDVGKVRGAGQRVHVGPVAREDRLIAKEGRVGLRLRVGGHGLRRDAVRDQILLDR